MPPHRHWAAWLAVIIAAVSLALNVVLIASLTHTQEAARQIVAGGLDLADDIARNGLAFDFSISKTFQIERDVPLQLNLDVPVKVDVPINTVVNVPLDLGALGARTIRIPINTHVPISVVVPIRLDRSFYISTLLPISLTVPIRLASDQLPISAWLPLIRERLQAAQRELDSQK